MHTVHLPYDGAKIVTAENGFIASAMGLIFDTDKDKQTRDFEDWEVKIIDDFFDSLSLDATAKSAPGAGVKVDKVLYGKLMMFVDMQNRWTYRGSVTTPPCATAVYWNVLRTVYPIKPKHLAAFKAQLANGYDQKPALKDTGNWRVIQPYIAGDKGTNGQIITNRMGGRAGMLIAVIILAIIVFVLLLVVMKLRMQLK